MAWVRSEQISLCYGPHLLYCPSFPALPACTAESSGISLCAAATFPLSRYAVLPNHAGAVCARITRWLSKVEKGTRSRRGTRRAPRAYRTDVICFLRPFPLVPAWCNGSYLHIQGFEPCAPCLSDRGRQFRRTGAVAFFDLHLRMGRSSTAMRARCKSGCNPVCEGFGIFCYSPRAWRRKRWEPVFSNCMVPAVQITESILHFLMRCSACES